MADRYWSYDINDGLQWHDTAAAAEDAADEALRHYRDEAESDGEWNDYVTSICWGEVRGHIVETTGTTEEYGEEVEWVDYHLAPVEEPSEGDGDGSPADDLAAALDEVERLTDLTRRLAGIIGRANDVPCTCDGGDHLDASNHAPTCQRWLAREALSEVSRG